MELLAPPSSRQKLSTRSIKIVVKAAFAVVFLVLGFDFSSSAFFKEYPLFGVNYLAEVLISIVAGLFGFYTFPRLLVSLKYWFETLISKTVSNIVSDFWEQQSKKMTEAKRQKQQILAEKQQKDLEGGVLLDTSALIDGRIIDIVKSGFLDNSLVVQKAVIRELQSVADSKDKIKRQRGRNGLDVLSNLKKYAKVVIHETDSKEADVDLKLVDFAKVHSLKLLTLDFNLMKVAKISNVKTLNINDLVESLKTVLLPGEEVEIEILQKGKEKKQGIGYLEDGTLVVVEDAIDKVGTKVKATVVKVIQSKAGKMFFCTPVKEKLA
jgi:rRNA-processing protein FCF1